MLDIEKLKAAREQLGHTQKQAAETAGMTLGRWNDIESGRRANVTLKTLYRLARVVSTNPTELLTKAA